MGNLKLLSKLIVLGPTKIRLESDDCVSCTYNEETGEYLLELT